MTTAEPRAMDFDKLAEHVPEADWVGDDRTCAEDGHLWPCPVSVAFQVGVAVGAGHDFAAITGLTADVMERMTSKAPDATDDE